MKRRIDNTANGSPRRRLWIVPALVVAFAVPAAAEWWPRGRSQSDQVRPMNHVEYVPGPVADPAITDAAAAQFADPTMVGFGAPSPAAPNPIQGVDCVDGCCGERGWGAVRPLDFQPFAQGEYVGHARLPHVSEYRLRVDD